MQQWFWYGFGALALFVAMLVRWRRSGRLEPPVRDTEHEQADVE